MTRIRRIVHPSDFSKASGAAFAKAIELAHANGAELLVVHVLAPAMPMMGADAYLSPKVYAEIDASARAYATAELDRLVTRAKKAGVRASKLLLDGVAHEQIGRIARARRADLVVIGTHGRTGLAKLFLGSVAGRVVATAAVPVMTVRGK